MGPVRFVIRGLIRFIGLWLVNALTLLATAAIVQGINIQAAPGVPPVVVAAGAALTLGIVNLLIRPLILLLVAPLGTPLIFLVGLFANAIVLRLTAGLMAPAFQVDNWWAAFLGSLVFSAINTVLINLMTLNDPDSAYRKLVERLARRSTFFADTAGEGRGLVMLEIDGLSYHHMQKAIQDGWMPHLRAMVQEEGYVLSRVESGVPSQTSACQTGILYGNNHDVPSYYWFDKDLGKRFESSVDAPLINERCATGHGLARGGSSIGNMIGGDAKKAMLTLSNLRAGSPEEKEQRARDIYLLMLNPYFFTRTLVLYFVEILVELWQAARQRIQNVQPRMNRLLNAYPLVRGAITVVVRDVSAYIATLDIIRGAPAVYITYAGYDEVAHNSGPWTRDAFGVLRQCDQVIGRLREVIAHKAPRPYELIILSDHGQSTGATFQQRYGHTLDEFIQQHLPQGMRAVRSSGGDDGKPSMVAMAAELENVQEQGVSRNVGRAVAGQTEKLLKQGAERSTPVKPAESAAVTLCGCGNLNHVYFDLYPRKVLLGELEAAYPGLVDALVGHDGVGFVVGYGGNGAPVALGRAGVHDLASVQVRGQDPLAPYVDAGLRAGQLRRLADFPHSGDLIVMGTLYPDGSVAGFEVYVGSHGGMGGEQTDAFLFHPPDLQVPETQNSSDVFAILNARRGLPGAPPRPAPAPAEVVDAWSAGNLLQGIRRVDRWLGRAVRAMFLDRSAYREVVRDVTMTGPALLIGLLASAVTALIQADGLNLLLMLGLAGLWLLTVGVIWLAGRLLGGGGDFTATLRGLGFAQSVYLLGLLRFVPVIAPLAGLIVTLMAFFAAWLGAIEAHRLEGWRTLLLPVAALVVFNLGLLILLVLLTGAAFSLTTLAQNLGLAP